MSENDPPAERPEPLQPPATPPEPDAAAKSTDAGGSGAKPANGGDSGSRWRRPVFHRKPSGETAAPASASESREGGGEDMAALRAAMSGAGARVPSAPTTPAMSPKPPKPRTPPRTEFTTRPPRRYGEHMATGVVLTLAGGSAVIGGILALQATDTLSFTNRAIVCGGVAAALLALAIVMRLIGGSEDVRGTLAVLGIGFATACMAFAYNPSNVGDHDNLVKFAIGAGVVSVLGWFSSIVVPSAVAGFLAAIATPAGAGAAIWLAFTSPTHVQVYVTALGVGLVLAVALPRLRLLRPHPTGLGWTLGGTAVAITLPALELITRGDAAALAAGSTAAAALLVLAQCHHHLPSALGALVGLAALEAQLVNRYLSATGADPHTTQLIAVSVGGGVVVLLVGLGVLLSGRLSSRLRWRVPVLQPAELLLLAALALAIVALLTGPGNVPFNPPQLASG